MSLNRLVLVINASYEPVNICTARRAMTLLFKGAAVVEVVSAHTVRTPQINIPLPSVVRLVHYKRMPRMNRSVSRKGIMLRDGATCQYCGSKAPAIELTLDHVMPRARGGQSTWENLVASCKRCNNRKRDRTPAEAGMVLVRQPRMVGLHARHRLMAQDQDAWEKYLFV